MISLGQHIELEWELFRAIRIWLMKKTRRPVGVRPPCSTKKGAYCEGKESVIHGNAMELLKEHTEQQKCIFLGLKTCIHNQLQVVALDNLGGEDTIGHDTYIVGHD